MNRTLVITLPQSDVVTEYLTHFSKPIEKIASERGVKIRALRGEEANKKEFEKAVMKLNPSFILLNGHGSETEIMGHNEIIVSAGTNDELLHGRIVYARSCSAAAILGEECTKNTKKGCFIGYDVDFLLYVDTTWDLNPEKDNIAKIFLEPSNLVSISIIKGNTTEDANNSSRKSMLKNIKKMLRTNSRESLLLAGALWNNYSGQVLLGNKEARIS